MFVRRPRHAPHAIEAGSSFRANAAAPAASHRAFYGNSTFFNIGLEHCKDKPDPGRFNVTKNEVDRGAPKTPSRHSVALGAPYFHNGQTATLKEPVRYMANGGKPVPNRTLLLQPRNLSEAG